MNQEQIVTISAQELLERIHQAPMLIVVNVLTDAQYNKCHIKDSVSVPLDQLKEIAMESWDKDAEIVVYCASYDCPLSKTAFKILHRLGFTNIKAYEGGIKEWLELGYPTVGACN